MDMNQFRKSLASKQNTQLLQESATATAAANLDQNLKKFIELGTMIAKNLETLEEITEPGDIRGLWSGPPRNVTFDEFMRDFENWYRKLSPELKRAK